MKKNIFYILRLSLTLLIITSAVAALLAGVNSITEDKIAAITKEKTDKAIAEVLPGEEYIDNGAKLMQTRNAQNWLEKNHYQLPAIVTNAYVAWNVPFACTASGPPRRPTGYAIEVCPTGFDGEISMMVGVDTEGNVLGISIISHTETAGLGAVAAADNAKGEAFRNQFIGMNGTLAVTKDGGTVDAISGATITSRAITEGVNAALEYVDLFEQRLRSMGL